MTLEAHFVWVYRASVLVNRCLPWIGVASNTLCFILLRGVCIAWYSSFSSGDTLPGNVGPREENTSNSNFAPREEDTSQCKWGAERRMHCMVILVLEKRIPYMALYFKRSGRHVKIWQNSPSTPSLCVSWQRDFSMQRQQKNKTKNKFLWNMS